MAHRLSRRGVLAGLAGSAVLPVPAVFPVPAVLGQTTFGALAKARVAIVGGGYGGATAARALKRLVPAATVTLIEPNRSFVSCPFSNLVFAGLRDLPSLTFGYDALRAEGVDVVHAAARAVDAEARTITLEDGASVSWDRMILSPGVDLRWGALEGYDEAASAVMPHAWKAGAQTRLLADQLAAMEDGGLVVMAAPAAPYRCPPGPYERASMIAYYLKSQKPRSKLLVLDAKDRFSKMPLFQEAWAEHYADVLEWRGASEDGRVSRVEPETMTLYTDFETIEADVANVIPPQKAAAIAERAGVADETGWCPIDATSFESTLQKGIHVIGDATIAAPMPKSAFSANLQAKVCAIQVARLLAGEAPQATVLTNTCYSYVTPTAAVSIAGVYSNADGGFANVPGAGGISPLGAGADVRQAEANQAADWFRALTLETFG